MRNVSNRVKIWACTCPLMIILYTYTHISLPFEFMKWYGNSTNPTPQELGSMSLRTSIAVPHDVVLLGNQHGFNRSGKSRKTKQAKKGDYGKLPWWDGGQCTCDRWGNCESLSPSLRKTETKMTKDFGTCGHRAAADGDKQKVISVSLYGKDPGYWNGLPEILSQARLLYPEWKVWIYANPRSWMKVLCPLLRKHDHLRICDVTNLPQPLYNISNVNPMLWRISPLGDPKVGSLLVRDSDSKLTEREQMAVQEWLQSGKTFHIMRDHPMHTAPILGGMWGARWDQSLAGNSSREVESRSSSHQALRAKSLRRIRNKIFVEAFNDRAYGSDQVLLSRILWPSMWSVMVHDSFYCEVYSFGWRPWPTERVNGSFVGHPGYRKEYANLTLDKECPPSCRHPDHPDWLYC
ncbi:uncharacterized protein [Macrobrachium rosenbergii]|uniref:uncharacterized protein n=1 Tax=Macrobrachium rosenbergii TaxID=79674 RepID=UPI0034D587F5